jgi:hypothetical protein
MRYASNVRLGPRAARLRFVNNLVPQPGTEGNGSGDVTAHDDGQQSQSFPVPTPNHLQGQLRAVWPQAVQMLWRHPEYAPYFDERFGTVNGQRIPGYAQQILKKRPGGWDQ